MTLLMNDVFLRKYQRVFPIELQESNIKYNFRVFLSYIYR